MIASDTAAVPDPLPFWGKIDCAESSRHEVIPSGGDDHETAIGEPQGDLSFRRLTVEPDDDIYGERCELGLNWSQPSDSGNGTFGPGPTVRYQEGDRRVTMLSIRIPPGTRIDGKLWRTVAQMKQAQPYDNPVLAPILELQVMRNRWYLQGDWETLWWAPAREGVWTRFAFDVTYSQDRAKGSVRLYVDLNGDGDFEDADERSPVVRRATLVPEITRAGGPIPPGESIPSHLRAGIYHHPDHDCPCSIDLDNVQIVAP